MPDNTGFEWLNLERVWREWNAGSAWAKAAMRQAMARTVAQARAIAQQYPRQNPRSTYRRTRTLGRSITGVTTNIPGGVMGVVGTKIPYANIVNAGHGVILPKRGKVLSWVTMRAIGRGKKKVGIGTRIFARRVGPWEGWHNFDKAIEQGKAILFHELKTLEIAVARRFNGSG